jgi:hypothetical protein
MRRKHMVKLGWVPANCNHQGSETWPGVRAGYSSPGPAAVPSRDECDLADCPGNHGWDHDFLCVRRVAFARRHQARRLWLLARELCASAALYRVEGSRSTATRTLRLAYTALRDRAEIAKAERGRD